MPPITLDLSCSRSTTVRPSANVLRAAAMFGLGVDGQRDRVIVPPLQLTLDTGRILFITGASGGGKSTLLRLIADALTSDTWRHNARVIRFDHLPDPPDAPLVDAFPDTALEETLALLSLAGLADAFVMLRTPGELSEGQRYRLRLAQAAHAVLSAPEDGRLAVILADEFGSTLDRITAKTIARNVRRWVKRDGSATRAICFIAATTHDDLLEALEPDVVIEKHPGSGVEVAVRVCGLVRV